MQIHESVINNYYYDISNQDHDVSLRFQKTDKEINAGPALS